MTRIEGVPVVNKEFEQSASKERNLRRMQDKFFWARYAPSGAGKAGHIAARVPFAQQNNCLSSALQTGPSCCYVATVSQL
jgi:hypothetical protein